MFIGLHIKYQLFWSDFNENLISLNRYLKITQISNFMKIHPVGVQLFCADGWTQKMKSIAAFRNFANAPKM
jgi:hypothetical protein